jgi:hypothetical protein
LKRKGNLAPILQARRTANGWVVTTSVNTDEQADLFVSVVRPNGSLATLSQNNSRVGQGVSGPPTKTISYRVLVPRTIPIKLTIPLNQLSPGTVDRIRIVARDPDGNESSIVIRFRT